MNVITAMILSTKRSATMSLLASEPFALIRKPAYQLWVTDNDDSYLLKIAHLIPDEDGSPKPAHFTKSFRSEASLTEFLTDHFGLDEWQPVEE